MGPWMLTPGCSSNRCFFHQSARRTVLIAIAYSAVVCVWWSNDVSAAWIHSPKYTRVGPPNRWTSRQPNDRLLRKSNPPTQSFIHRQDDANAPVSTSTSPSLERLLHETGFGTRLCHLSLNDVSNQNVWAEVVIKGDTHVVLVTSVIMSNSDGSVVAPKLAVEYMDPAYSSTNSSNGIHKLGAVIDFGQVTTIWNDMDQGAMDHSLPQGWPQYHSLMTGSRQSVVPNDDSREEALDRLYQGRIGKTLSSTRGTQTLTKKQIATLLDRFFGADRDDSNPPQAAADAMLRQLCKTGPGFSRLVDSSDLVSGNAVNGKPPPTSTGPRRIQQRLYAVHTLASDSTVGGRFKRWPCLFVGYDPPSHVISFINGGWLVTDPSVRAGTEARKFVERGHTTVTPENPSRATRTLADTRILRRLECLAMGELTATPRHDDRAMSQHLELDVRETLNAMNLPLNPDGAKRALVQTGHWSEGTAAKLDRLSQSATLQPWSPHILEAANWFSNFIGDQPTSVDVASKRSVDQIVDLRQLPCVSVDAARATFRDDAFGVRKRANTGRRVVTEASQWEILIHIADVSVIYADHGENQADSIESNPLSILRCAAESRGSSRYDLPLGPLHLFPPVVLRALAFPDEKTPMASDQRCVTLWAYIDERDGRLLDCGVERTVTSLPIKLSFSEASSIMGGKASPETNKARAILLVAERNLKKWQDYQYTHNEAAQKREVRLRSRESSSRKANDRDDSRDDGVDGFKRSRGHRLVDSALDLYSIASSGLLRRAKAPAPRAIGADASRGGRFATAPLRRYIDGQAQRQILAVLCGYGRPMSLDDCKEAAKVANKATNAISNIRSIRSN